MILQQDPAFLRQIEDQYTLDSLILHLDLKLREQWFQHKHMRLAYKTEIGFHDFADLVKVEDEVSRDYRELNLEKLSNQENTVW